jgi:hypothetical protein
LCRGLVCLCAVRPVAFSGFSGYCPRCFWATTPFLSGPVPSVFWDFPTVLWTSALCFPGHSPLLLFWTRPLTFRATAPSCSWALPTVFQGYCPLFSRGSALCFAGLLPTAPRPLSSVFLGCCPLFSWGTVHRFSGLSPRCLRARALCHSGPPLHIFSEPCPLFPWATALCFTGLRSSVFLGFYPPISWTSALLFFF